MAVTPNSIVTPQTPKNGYAVCTTANTTLSDSPSNTALLATAGANGGRVTRVSVTPRTSITATHGQLYLSKDAGTTKRLINTALMTAYTFSGATEIPTTDFGYSDDNPLILEAADRLYVAIGVTPGAGDICFFAEWADY